MFRHLDAWQRTQVARHLDRPYTLDYVRGMMSDWVELHGDRAYGDDAAIVAGFATFRGRSVAVVGHEKGRGTNERIRRNFGQANPEGHRKALRVMRLAARFGKPVVSLIDTPGAYPGKGAEERGQAESIAANLIEMAALPVPIVAVITGEGWSGGALAIGVADRVLMLEYAVHSVITPEGCAAILWRDQERKADAAEALQDHRSRSAAPGRDRRDHPRAGRRRAGRSRRDLPAGGRPPRRHAAQARTTRRRRAGQGTATIATARWASSRRGSRDRRPGQLASRRRCRRKRRS